MVLGDLDHILSVTLDQLSPHYWRVVFAKNAGWVGALAPDDGSKRPRLKPPEAPIGGVAARRVAFSEARKIADRMLLDPFRTEPTGIVRSRRLRGHPGSLGHSGAQPVRRARPSPLPVSAPCPEFFCSSPLSLGWYRAFQHRPAPSARACEKPERSAGNERHGPERLLEGRRPSQACDGGPTRAGGRS